MLAVAAAKPGAAGPFCAEYRTIICTREFAGSSGMSGETVPAKAALPNTVNKKTDFDNNLARRGLSILPFRVQHTCHVISLPTNYNQWIRLKSTMHAGDSLSHSRAR